MKKKILALFIASLGSIFTVNSFAAEKVVSSNKNADVNQELQVNKKYTIRVAHVVKATTPKGQSAEHFKAYMEAKFPGRVEVTVFHDNSLFKDKEETEALNLGAVDIILPSSPKIVGIYKATDFEIFDLPYLFNSQLEVNKFVASDTAKKMLDNFGRANNKVIPLALWPNDFRQMIGKHEFKKKSDFAKDKIRLESDSKTLLNMHEAFKTKETIVLPYGDLYGALNGTGRIAVDSTDNVLANIYNSKLYESSKVITMTNHSYMFYVLLANKRWFNSLPVDIQDGIKQTAVESGLVNAKLVQEGNKAMQDDMVSKGVTIINLSDSEKIEMKSWMKPVHADFAKRVNNDLLTETYSNIKD